jgi:hypothetical protein
MQSRCHRGCSCRRFERSLPQKMLVQEQWSSALGALQWE